MSGNSGRKCKSCQHEKRDVIDALLNAGVSDLEASRRLKLQGIDISQSSLFRHRTMCLTMKSATVRKTDPESPLAIPVEKILANVTSGQPHAAVVELLLDAAVKLAAGVNHEVSRYIAGEGVAPDDSMTALRNIHAVLEKEAVVGYLEVDPDASITEKADAIVSAVIAGRLSPSNGDRLLTLLARRCELTEFQDLRDQIDRMMREVQAL